MAATIDEAMDSLLLDFDQIYNDFKNGVSENQSLRGNCIAEGKKREALESTVSNLQSENERLARLYTESLEKLADKIELRTSYQTMKEELKRLNDEHLRKDTEYRNTMEMLKQNHARKIEQLESQIRGYHDQKVENEAAMNQICQDLAGHRNHVEFLTRRLENVSSELESRCDVLIAFSEFVIFRFRALYSSSNYTTLSFTDHDEIQGLKDCILIERAEKEDITKRLEDLEKECAHLTTLTITLLLS
ncbi:OLC1v1036107C1 [Oldenlandia corymbosa var. corymbosa]|uniref:OLC1v1036107C1 n=1 Tax=Oldenlandia corymbosa var. corymbosa TaxID=529605 RepID=A0AAV1CY12_OLDCO|nr:OLC1v1036107C1 [Oldenlandia corymbosa var. corymbosa]